MEIEHTKYFVAKKYLKIRLQMQTTNFLKSCITEGFLPKGLNVAFSLAMDVNDPELVTQIEQILDFQGSRILDTLFIKSQSLERTLERQYEEVMANLRRDCLEEEVRRYKNELEVEKRKKERSDAKKEKKRRKQAHWDMTKWVVQFIEENKEKWDRMRKQKRKT